METSSGTKSVNVINLLSKVDVGSAVEVIKVKTSSVTLSSSSWNGEDSTFEQTITIDGVTANSKIDLQPDSIVLNQMITDGVHALYIENNNGILTAYAIGSAPTVSLTIQVAITEVEAVS